MIEGEGEPLDSLVALAIDPVCGSQREEKEQVACQVRQLPPCVYEKRESHQMKISSSISLISKFLIRNMI